MVDADGPLRDLEPFDPSLGRRPANVFELLCWIVTYKDTILIRTRDGKNVPISELSDKLAQATIADFIDRFQTDDTATRWVPHRVLTDDVDRENMQHASWQVLALRDWTKVARVWKDMNKG